MIDIRKQLEAKKAKALQEAAEIDSDLQELEKASQLAAKYGLELVEKNTKAVTGEKPRVERVRLKERGAEPVSRHVRREAEAVIRSAGKPLSARYLFADAQKKGIKIKGKRPESTYSAFLHGADNLELAHRGWWWIKGLSVPEGWEPEARKAA